MQPLFVFSIARSGSTLVQRVLGSYREVATVSEPWILIPLLYTMRRRGVIAEYTHYLVVDAVEDLAGQFPGGLDDYRSELHDFVLRLYEKAAPDKPRYFLDKTPPYFFVVDEVMEMFPEGKFIFLSRNPLSVAASFIHWRDGRWDPAFFRENLFDGIARLASAQSRHADKVCSVRYEDLITGGEGEWRRIADYLELDFDPETLTRFQDVRLEGRLGDPHGTKRYGELSSEPLTKWRSSINTPLRKAWARRYLRWIGTERLAVMGYDLDELLAELDSVPSDLRELPGDCLRSATALMKEPMRARARRSLGLGGPSALRYLISAPGYEKRPDSPRSASQQAR